ncbi:MAG: hypothetical protein AAF577_11825 [Pseudomonadota bacterium]
MLDAVYFAVAIVALIALAGVIVVIGRVASDCPQTGAAARLGTWIVTTGFVTLGAGAIALIAAALPSLSIDRMTGLYAASGLMLIALGIGFYIAAAMLRDILATARQTAGPLSNPSAATSAMANAA